MGFEVELGDEMLKIEPVAGRRISHIFQFLKVREDLELIGSGNRFSSHNPLLIIGAA